jgi:anthranilate/para-aminobenzoate synthase component I
MNKVWRLPLPHWIDPEKAVTVLSSGVDSYVWLDSGHNAETGSSYLGFSHSSPQFFSGSASETVFSWLTTQLDAASACDVSDASSSDFTLGWVGWLGYELAHMTTGVDLPASSLPDAAWMHVDWAIEFDHAHSQCFLLSLSGQDRAHQLRGRILEKLQESSAGVSQPVQEYVAVKHATWRHSPEKYRELVGQCLSKIQAGDAYQLCLTNSAHIEGSFDPLDTYLALRRANPSHHGGLLKFGEYSLLSSSPEVFLRISAQRHMATKPIKGTRPRGASVKLDNELAAELVSSEKERAENLMIVDLMRNDVGKVAKLGTVRVDSLLAVESYHSVHQLVSTVSADLASDVSVIDAIHACFPAGSMTGAPKISAISLLSEFEGGPRGIYSGAFGYIGLNGAVDLAMVIRSIVLSPQGAWVGTGGGITSGSDPQAELEETFIKVAPLLKVLGVSQEQVS